MTWWQWYRLPTQNVGEEEEVGIVEGDYLSWDPQWADVLDNGLDDEAEIDWVVDEVRDVVSILWADGDNYCRFGVFNLSDFSTVFLSDRDVEYHSCIYSSYGIKYGGANEFSNSASRSIQSYLLFSNCNTSLIQIWRGGAEPLWTHSASIDFDNGNPNPAAGISPTGKYVILVSDQDGGIACFKGSASAATSRTFGNDTSYGKYVIDANYAIAHNQANGEYNGSYIGQRFISSNYYINRYPFCADTSFLSGKTITAAYLYISVNSKYAFGDADGVQVQYQGASNPHCPMENADYDQALYSGNGGQISGASIGEKTNALTLNATGRGWINKTGTTRFILRSLNDINSVAPTASEWLHIADIVLYVEYS